MPINLLTRALSKVDAGYKKSGIPLQKYRIYSCTHKSVNPNSRLLHSHRFRQVTRLVDVGAFDQRDVVRQQL
jgi:hypothetical protein